MSHGYGALALPFTLSDFSAGFDLSVDYSTPFVATLAPPPDPGWYNFGATGFDMGQALEDALNAADGTVGGWIVERTRVDCVERYRFIKAAASPTFTFEWEASSLAAEYFGFEEGSVVTSEPYVQGIFNVQAIVAPYAPGRVWFPPNQLWDRRDPERVTAHSMSYAGVVEKRRYSVGWKHMDLSHGPVVEARLFKSAVSDSDLNLQVPGLDLADPNYPLESLWDWIASRTPLRWTHDWENSPDDYIELEARDNAWSTRFSQPLTLIEETSPPQWQVTLPLIDYKTSGSDFDLASVVCSGGDPVEYDTLWLASQAPLDSVVLVNQTAAGNAPAIEYKAVRVDEPWFFEPHPMVGNAWLPGKIDSEVGAPGSGRFLVYRAVDATPFTINGDLELEVVHDSTTSLQWWMPGATKTTGVEVAIPMARGGSLETVVDCPTVTNFVFLGGGTFTSSDWLGVLLLVRPSAESIQSYGVYGGVVSQATSATDYNDYNGLPIRLRWTCTYQTAYPIGADFRANAGYVTSLNAEGVAGFGGSGQSWLDDSNDEVDFARAFVAAYGDDETFTIETIGPMNPLNEQGFGGVPS